jgi:hypothetical protein
MIKLNSLLAREFVAIQPNPRDLKSLANYIRILHPNLGPYHKYVVHP